MQIHFFLKYELYVLISCSCCNDRLECFIKINLIILSLTGLIKICFMLGKTQEKSDFSFKIKK